MKAIYLVAMLGAACAVQARTWTNTEGKTLEAELVRVKDGQVYLQIGKTRQIHPFDIGTFSAEDQRYVREYEQEQANRLKQQAVKERTLKWHEDYAKAKAEADELGFPILLLYTAPEWCGYCRLLDGNILERSEFKEYAKANLVLYVADFSDRAEGEKWKKRNPDLVADFPCSGYPCAYLVSTDGKSLGKIGGCDEKWGPSDYIAKLEKFKEAPPSDAPKKRRKKAE